MNKYLIAFLFLITTPFIFSQSISGNFSQLNNQPIKVEGFSGLKTYAISSTITDEKGNFKLNYSKSDFGVGYLIASDNNIKTINQL